jgi:hypothetical protein
MQSINIYKLPITSVWYGGAKMVKRIFVIVDDNEHERYIKAKGFRTWKDVIEKGVECIENDDQ